MPNRFRIIYLNAINYITETEGMHIYVTNNERIFRVSLSSRIKMAFLLRNPLCANSKDTSGAGESMQLLLDRGSTRLQVMYHIVK